MIENAFCRLKDFRGIATSYELAANFFSAVVIAAVIAYWL